MAGDGGLTLMVAIEGSWQEFLMKTKALVPDAQAFPLSKDFPAVRLPAVSRASDGPASARCAVFMASACPVHPGPRDDSDHERPCDFILPSKRLLSQHAQTCLHNYWRRHMMIICQFTGWSPRMLHSSA